MNSAEIFDLLERINATSSRTEKEALLAPHIENETLRKVFRFACDPLITFGLTAEKPKAALAGEETFGMESHVWELLEALKDRVLTGNNAKVSTASIMVRLEHKSAQLLWRILSKDLRCGMTAATINKVSPGLVPLFAVMLAHKYEEKRITQFPVAVEPKLDGLRVIALVRDGSARFFSRTGKPFPALDHLGPLVVKMAEDAVAAASKSGSEIERTYRRLLGGGGPARIALDAEVTSGSFLKTSGDVRRKSESAEDAVLNVFDAVPFDVMTGDQKDWGATFKLRRHFVHFIVGHAPVGSPIQTTPLRIAQSHEEIQAIYEEHRANGLEGAMVKPLDGSYRKARSHNWLKIKAEESEDLRITGAFAGTGKYEGMLGGLIVDRAGIEVRVGGGFSDQQRTDIWDELCRDENAVVGRLIEIEFHEVTPDGSLRHPRFVRFRDDKDERIAA